MASSSTNPVRIIDNSLGPVDLVPVETIVTELAEIGKFKMHRNQGYHWAAHQLKVLVSNEVYVPYDPDDPQDMERYAIELSLQDEDASPSSSTPDDGREGCFEREVADCPRCSIYPRFSRYKKTRKFRLVQPWEYLKSGDEQKMCDHFLAVSYCWGSYENAARDYQIQDCTGRRRDTPRPGDNIKGKDKDENLYLPDYRTPFNQVLDRAVELASHEGLHCIWIDQACLPQDESEEHQMGVQSMDMVYKRAARTAGLLESVVTSQSMLDALAALFAWVQSGYAHGETPGQDWWDLHFAPDGVGAPAFGLLEVHTPEHVQQRMAKDICRTVLQFIEMLLNDRWYSRAWILQESVSAGPNLVLLMSASPGLRYDCSPFVPHNGRLLQSRKHDAPSLGLTRKDFRILTDATVRMIDAYYDNPQVGSSVQAYGPDGVCSPDNQFVSVSRKILSPGRLQWLHPVHLRCGVISCKCSVHYVCNAASALTFLRNRHCMKPEDKVAIVANLCKYDLRLDTFQLAKRFRSLRMCLLMLALLNGDLSLLVREHYKLGPVAEPLDLPLLAFPYAFMHELDKISVEASPAPRFQLINNQLMRPRGVTLPAYLWCVDRQVDFGPIREKWSEKWWRMKCLAEQFFVLPGDSRDDFRQRPAVTMERLGREGGKEMFRIRDEIRRRKDPSANQAYVDDAYPGVRFFVTSSFALLRGNEEVRDMAGAMVRDILSYLFYSGEEALADSIWQSLRAPRPWSNTKGLLPDHVGDALFAYPVFQERPMEVLQFDETRDGKIAQEWLFDRIVLQGRLWVGHYVPTNMAGSGMAAFQPLAVVSNNVDGNMRVYHHPAPSQKPNNHSNADHTLDLVRRAIKHNRKGQEEEISYLLESWATKPMSVHLSNILGRDAVKHILVDEMTHSMESPDSFQRSRDVIQRIAEAVCGMGITMLAMMHYMDTDVGWDIEKQDVRSSKRVAAFNVDGCCMVATPFDTSRERLPHSEERTMSACWVVERQSMDIDEREAEWIRREFVRTRRLLLGATPESSHEEISDIELRHLPDDVVERMSALRLRVVSMVEGVWEVIDPVPFQSFLFT